MVHGKIIETGSYIPAFNVTNDDLSKMVETSDEWIYTRTGIRNRRIAKDETVADMAAGAAQETLDRSGVDASEIDLILVACVSADMAMPSVACMVQERIGADNAFCFDINAACAGFVYGLDIAEQFIRSGRVKKAIVVGSEKLSQLIDWEDRSTCVLFGDGAGAVLIEATEEETGIMDTVSKAIGKQSEAITSPHDRKSTPFYEQESRPFICMDGRAVFQFAVTKVSKLFKDVFARMEMDADDVDLYVLHQANSRILDGIAKRLKQPIEKFYMNMERYGNTSAATIPIALHELNLEGKLEGKTLALSGFGAGLTYASAIVKF